MLFKYVLKCVPILLITLHQHKQEAAVFSRNIRYRSSFLHKQSKKTRPVNFIKFKNFIIHFCRVICAALLSCKPPHRCFVRRMHLWSCTTEEQNYCYISSRLNLPFQHPCSNKIALKTHFCVLMNCIHRFCFISQPYLAFFSDCEKPQLFFMTSAVCPIRQFAMTVSSQWSRMSRVSLWAMYDSLCESSLGVTHG